MHLLAFFFKSTYALFVCVFFCVSVCIVTKVILSNISNIPYAYVHVLNVFINTWSPRGVRTSVQMCIKKERKKIIYAVQKPRHLFCWTDIGKSLKYLLLFFQGMLYWFLYKNDWWFNLVFYVVPDVSPQKKI